MVRARVVPLPIGRPPMRPLRTAVDRWGVLQSLVRRLDALVQASAYLDLGHATGPATRIGAVVEREMERIAARVEAEATRVTVEAAERYLEQARRKARVKR